MAWYLPERVPIHLWMQELLYSDYFAHVQTQDFGVGLGVVVLKQFVWENLLAQSENILRLSLRLYLFERICRGKE